MGRRCAGGWISIGLIGLICAVLAGCGSAPTPAAAVPSAGAAVTPAPTSAAPSPTPSPTPTATATPFVSSADEAGAHAFVVAYFAELDRAYATGDVSRLKPYRLDTCICVRNERLIRDTYGMGGRIRGVNFQILGWTMGARGPAFARTAIAVQMPTVRYETPGKPTLVDSPVHGYYAIDLRRQANYWQISDIRVKVVQ